jgi:hypothetical protein
MSERYSFSKALPWIHWTICWPRGYFVAEDRLNEPRQDPPAPRQRLKAGDRVSFDLNEGVDGPAYATNVRIVEPD